MVANFSSDLNGISISSVKRLLGQWNVHVNTIFSVPKVYKYKTTLLCTAVKNKNEKLVNYLISKGADANITPPRGKAPLFIAAEQGSLRLVQKLHQIGGNINYQRQKKKNHNVISIAICNKHYEVAEYLIKNGADVNAEISFKVSDILCNRILHIAAIRASMNLIGLLVDHKVDVYAETREGLTATEIARRCKNFDIAQLLYIRGANNYHFDFGSRSNNHSLRDAYRDLILSNEFKTDIHSFINKYKTILFLVIQLDPGNSKLIQTLLDAGVNINSVNWDDRHAVDIRISQGRNYVAHPEITKHIVKLMSVGFRVCKRNRLAVERNEFDSIRSKCHLELRMMKIINFDGSHVLFFDVLVKNLQCLAVRFKYVKLEPIARKEKLCEVFPLYGGMLFYKLCEVNRRIKLMEKVENSIENELCSVGLGYDIVKKLWWYLSNDELEKCSV